MGQSIGPDIPGRRNGLRPRPGEPDNPGHAARGGDGTGCALSRESRIIRGIEDKGARHIPLGRKEVITICGQGSAGSIVGFEGRFFLR